MRQETKQNKSFIDFMVSKVSMQVNNNQQYQFQKSIIHSKIYRHTMIINKDSAQLTFDQLENTTRDINFSKYTPKRIRASDGQIFNKMEKQLNKLTRRLDKMNQLENEDTFGLRSNQNLQPRFDVSKSRNTISKIDKMQKDKAGKLLSTTPKIQRRESFLKDRINNYKDEKLNTFRTQKQQNVPMIDPHISQNETIKKTKHKNIDTFALLIDQNQNLARKIGELQIICGNMNEKIGFWKYKFQEQSKVIEQATVKQKKENVYLMNLVNYYKTIAFKLHQKLVENGINTQCTFTEYSSDSQIRIENEQS